MGFLLLSSLLLASASAEPPEPAWVLIDRRPHLSLAEWGRLSSFTPIVDEKSGRVLLERKGLSPLILLLESPYALRGGVFLALPDAPFSRGGQVLLSAASAERVLLPALPAADRSALEKRIADARGRAEQGACLNRRALRRIFLDPGHGGEDAGTRRGAVKEKEVVLRFAELAADQLRRRGFEVAFSRTKDVFVPLEIRPRLAAEWKADLFVSLHVNSSPLSSAQGTETYILNQEATDAEARKLALLENSIAGKKPEAQSAVQDILWDMEQTAYLQDSAYLAADLQQALVERAHEFLRKRKEGAWKNRGVRQAPFYVLNRAPMPAVLVEIGYLSNLRDRRLMGEAKFLESLAKAVADGVKKYSDACRKAL